MRKIEMEIQELIDNGEFSELSYEYEMTEFPKKDMRKRERRKTNVTKATRKKSLHRQIAGEDLYDNLHQYSKNKIHCSCPKCAFNAKVNGKIVYGRSYPAQDMRNMEKMDYSMREYKTA